MPQNPFDENWLAGYEAKRKTDDPVIPEEVRVEVADLGPEGELQSKIEQWCGQNGLPYFHDRSRGANSPGFPDLVIAVRSGRTLWIELKSQSGRMRKEQTDWRLKLMALGHRHYVVRSFKKFLGIMAEQSGLLGPRPE